MDELGGDRVLNEFLRMSREDKKKKAMPKNPWEMVREQDEKKAKEDAQKELEGK